MFTVTTKQFTFDFSGLLAMGAGNFFRSLRSRMSPINIFVMLAVIDIKEVSAL